MPKNVKRGVAFFHRADGADERRVAEAPSGYFEHLYACYVPGKSGLIAMDHSHSTIARLPEVKYQLTG